MKTKTFFLVIYLVTICSCNNDDTIIVNDSIAELTLNNLVELNSNIPQDFYDDLTFTTESIGYAISRTGKILKTIDGGENWSVLNSNVSFPLRKIQFVNNNTGFVIGGDDTGSYLLKTTNAGQSWSTIHLNTTENGSPTGIFFKNENEGYITGNKIFIKTVNGGLNWTNVLTNTDENFNDVKFKDEDYGVVTANTGDYYRTTNGGNSWQVIELNNQNNLTTIYFVCGKTLVKSGNKLIDIENSSSLTLPNPINKLQYLNASKCIGIGQHFETGFFPYGDILLTNNNWSTFVQKSYQPSTEAMNFTAIAIMNSHKTMMLGTGQLYTKIITISY